MFTCCTCGEECESINVVLVDKRRRLYECVFCIEEENNPEVDEDDSIGIKKFKKD